MEIEPSAKPLTIAVFVGSGAPLERRPSKSAREPAESSDAFASTLLASKNSSSLHTSPASTPYSTIRSKKRLKTPKPKRSLILVRLEWSGRLQ